MIGIYNADGGLVLAVEVDDTSYRYRAIMGEDSLTLKFALAEHVEIPVGAWCEWQGCVYTLERPESLTMHHTRYFEYTVTMESPQAKAKVWKFRNTVDGRLKFSLTAKPVEHLQMFVDNMNARMDADTPDEDLWRVGECIENDEVCISYDHAYCYDALGQMADTFETEFEINGRTVSLHKVEYNKADPLALSYGRGNGFKPDVGRQNYGDLPPVEILYTQGGSDNIDAGKYGNSDLLLPRGQSIRYDGEKFEDEEGFDGDAAREYVTDEQGYSIRRGDRELSAKTEDSLDCSEIYPKRVGEISKVEEVDADKNFWDFWDEDIPEALDYGDCLIAGETMTVIFQSGMLSGKEFEVSYSHADRHFEIQPQEIDGITMPGETESGVRWVPEVGDKYAVFNCMLPDAYICDNDTKSGAEWDMFRKGVKYLFENEDQKYTISGKMDGIWSKKDWENIGGRIVLGGYVRFTDARWEPEGALMRIVGVKDYINRPHSPELELSNGTVAASFGTTLNQLESAEVLIGDNYRKSVAYTKRRWRDAKETMTMLEQSLLASFTESISPIAVQTMQLLAGDESLQYRFVDGLNGSAEAQETFTYDPDAMQLRVEGAGTDGVSYLQHLTLGITEITSERDAGEYYCWALPSYASAVLDDGTKAYYLYARVKRYTRVLEDGAVRGADDQTGTFLLSETAIGMEEEGGWWHLLVGILNSESGGTRSFAALYGFTEVLPGRITTDKIVSTDGKTYFDLVNGLIAGTFRFLDGLVSGLIGIGNDYGINAGMSGEGGGDGGANLDTDVRIWAGSEADGRADAPFRVLHDGSLIASKATIEGKITATSGSIGGYTISGDGISKSTDITIGDSPTTRKLDMSESVLTFKGYEGSTLVTTALVGADTYPVTAGGDAVAPINIEVTREKDTSSLKSYANNGLVISVSGVTDSNGYGDFTNDENHSCVGNHALHIDKGDIYGFRLKTRRVTASQTLSIMDSIVIAMREISLAFPDGAEDGQIYFIRNASGGRVILTASTSVTLAAGEMGIVIYNAVAGVWYANAIQIVDTSGSPSD